MALFSQALTRSIRSSLRPGTPKERNVNKEYDTSPFHTTGMSQNRSVNPECDISPLTPIMENASLSFDCCNTKRKTLPQRRWNVLPIPTPKSSAATGTTKRDKVLVSSPENDQNKPLSQVDEWNDENDDVTLLPRKTVTNIVSVLYPSDGEGFDITSSSSCMPPVTKAYSSHQLSSAPIANNSTSQKIWNKVSSLKQITNHRNQQTTGSKKKMKKRKKEIEIQFECFFEDDELSGHDNFLSSSPPTTNRGSPKASLFRKTTVVQSWFTQTFGTVKRGGVMSTPSIYKGKKTRPRGTNTTEPTYDYDDCDDSEVQIIFEKTKIDVNGQIENDESRTSEDDISTMFSHQAWDMEELVQFRIPNDVPVEPSSWEYYEDWHCKCHQVPVSKISTSFYAPIV